MKIHLASGNAHKVREMQELADQSAAAGGVRIAIVAPGPSGGMPAVEEDAGTFIGNARKKALALKSRLPDDAWVLADDSGLCVDALGGGPGVESAYYAGPQGDAAANLAKLVAALSGVPAEQRGAHFVCVLVLAGPEGEEQVFEGLCGGSLLVEPRGGAGFGYDPLFVPTGQTLSFAELGDAVKHRLSHRSRAWQRLADWAARLGGLSRT